MELASDLFFRLVSLAPRAWDAQLSRGGVHLLRLCAPGLHSRLLDHLRLIYAAERSPEQRRELAEAVWRHLGDSLVEFARMGQLTPAELRRRTLYHGGIHLRRARARGGGGVIVLSGHVGNFEHLSAALALRYGPWAVLVREKDTAGTEAFVDRVRRRFDQTVIHKAAWRRGVKLLRQGYTLGIAADQAALVGGVLGTFLGQRASTPLGPLVLARLTGAPVCPVYIHRDANGRQTVEVHAPLDLPPSDDVETYYRVGAQSMNDAASARIRWKPDDWLWLHRRWKTPLTLWQGSERD